MPKLDKETVEKLKKNLSTEQYNICFLKGTEPPGSGKYTHNTQKGMYKCAVCDTDLFTSDTKFESLTGWPSFFDVIKHGNVELEEDKSMGMSRTEVLCNNCGAHLGHVFDDGPEPTGKRYCINSLALGFKPS